ncbi:PREDICTED: ankyrin repeat and SOCS box protein 10 [Chaetura pelagica]|uniref:ankyrin repeat and SOCS box protein 10 n=1 Tax=Chaetura pelagica TaxID=8897 RepID=UPI000523A586|nr:PREDICTED: ankyrin repeat and SOCS box protein 10 [Chaetura pelagica]
MDCALPPSPAARQVPLLGEEQQKHSRCSGHQHHPQEHSPSSLGQGHQSSRLEPLECRDLLVQNALFVGDLEMVQKYFTRSAAVNLIIETRGEELRWTSRKRGLSLRAMDCALPPSPAARQVLLLGEEQQKHSRCSGHQHHPQEHSPSSLGRGHQSSRLEPLECRDLLVQNALFVGDLEMVQKYFTRSAAVNLIIETRGEELRWTSRKRGLWSLSYEQELTTPLLITASRGYTECLRLLLLRGADPELAPGGRSALHQACAAARPACARLLLAFGADPQAGSEDGYKPLHLCKSPDSFECVEQLLQHGASVNSRTEEEGDTALHIAARHGALHNILQAAAYKLEQHPELVVRALLNHGAVRIWPGALLKVLRCCHSCPRLIEALINSYDRVRVSADWVGAVPAEVVQKYPRFYQSLFSLEHRPRSLQHLARCTLRTFLEGRLLLVLPQLHLPSALHRFLLLDFEDVLY